MNETPTYSFREPDKTHYRTIFLSDIHLGTRGCRADLLLEFLKEHTCDQLYLVGDIIDGWRFKKGFYWPQEHTNVMRRFLTLSKRGTQVTYVTGNHDEFLRKYSDMEVGNIRIVDEAVHRTSDGRRFLVVHGDAYDVVTLYHSWVAKLGGLGYDMLVELNTHLNRWRA
ncbi:MAG TPA: UDP-2,3-diacylglucosamine diphosphatase, partial [Pseudomonadales bacterium]|nr:UDP-2,3-diacylglucosamine diphosphatase [Pseudomonadales bacterium]